MEDLAFLIILAVHGEKSKSRSAEVVVNAMWIGVQGSLQDRFGGELIFR
jgi:hypothetical protein